MKDSESSGVLLQLLQILNNWSMELIRSEPSWVCCVFQLLALVVGRGGNASRLGGLLVSELPYALPMQVCAFNLIYSFKNEPRKNADRSLELSDLWFNV